MKILITGGFGFLGRQVAERLLPEGHELILTSRVHREDLRPGVRCCQMDLTDVSTLHHLPNAVDAIVHTAALIPSQRNHPWDAERFWATNALGTLRLLEWGIAHGVRTFIYCSSMSVYAPDVPLPVTEDSLTYPLGNGWAYGLSKLSGEIFCAHYHHKFDRLFSLRLSTLYGYGMLAHYVLAIFLERARAGKPLEVHGRATSGDFLYVKDAALAVHCALRSAGPGGLFNIGSGVETTILELAETVRDLTPEAKSAIVITEAAPARRFSMDISKARRALGFEPSYTLRTGLADWLQGETQGEAQDVSCL